MNRLRGNTFLLLLLRAGCQVLLNPQEYGESKGGVTKPNMLADLIPVTNPYAVFYDAEPGETLSEEDIVDYLIQSGTTPEMLVTETDEE